ncbi:oligosaccharide flippase family protein [Photobacterium leiognathi]|uniref:oligosaccharide flippase family protein n=1 Tax=Photobacterium leiognathi TaxID=553611 RepID=UPI0034E3AA5C
MLITNRDGKRFLENVLSLGSIQVVNYILPLLTVPYLVRVLGVDYFGLLAFSTVIINYLMLITDYGFNLTATKEVSINRFDNNKVSEIFSSVLIVKMLLTVLCFFLLLTLILTIGKIGDHSVLYLITFLSVIGQSLFPIWLFQGIEKNEIYYIYKCFYTCFIHNVSICFCKT